MDKGFQSVLLFPRFVGANPHEAGFQMAAGLGLSKLA